MSQAPADKSKVAVFGIGLMGRWVFCLSHFLAEHDTSFFDVASSDDVMKYIPNTIAQASS